MLPFVDARDPGVFGGVALVLVAISVIAAALPAWRASGLDASQALRSE
jgi:ABC-type lipoprotein release transport system permease subunit